MPGIRIEVLETGMIETYDHETRTFQKFPNVLIAVTQIKKYILRDLETLKAESYSKPVDLEGGKTANGI